MDEKIYGLISDAFDQLMDSPHSEVFIEDIFSTAIRLNWHFYLQPTLNLEEAKAFCATKLVSTVRQWLREEFEHADIEAYLQKEELLDDEILVKVSIDTSFESVMAEMFRFPDETDATTRAALTAWHRWRPRLINLSPNLVHSITDVYQEYILWLQKHPDVLDKVAWEAFERLVAEVFASRGFSVELTGRVRNKSADIIAVRTDEFGIETKYLVECKRYGNNRRIGLDIVNGVIGAARRAAADHAFLVTSTFFTQEVERKRQEFADLHLHLRDGDAVREWLRDYKVHSEGGLWLAPGWEEQIQYPIKSNK
jgi:HJR/Mrr/RecB family endonuclease